MTREVRTAQILEVREDGSDHYADLLIVSYGVVDTYKTSWKSGVFTRSIASGVIPSMWCHDDSRPIGTVGGFTDTSQNLRGRLHFLDFDACPDARMAYEAMKRGAMPGVSFAFERKDSSPDPEHRGATRIDDADLFEISPVLVNSVPGSRVLAVRAVASEEPISRSIAADILTRFSVGQIDLYQALGEVKAGVVTTDLSEDDIDHSDDEEVIEEVELTEAELQAQADAAAAEQAEDDAIYAQLDGLTAWDNGRAAKPKPYGDVKYADPENGKYPIDTKDHVKAAWSYINMPKNAAKYSSEKLKTIKSRIKAAAKKFGIEVKD